MISALFVEARGIYAAMGLDVWDVERDARLYDGEHPVIAHPPCQLWVNFAALNYKRYGGEHNRPGNDGGCFASALASVRRCGGVLEHPAFSNAFAAHGIPAPAGIGWRRVGEREWVCEVWQSAYGHRARKRTWLFYAARRNEREREREREPFNLDWRRAPGTAQVGWFDRIKPTLSKREANATPRPFAEVLVMLAAWSR